MTEMEDLWIQRNQITDISTLSGMTGMIRLYLVILWNHKFPFYQKKLYLSKRKFYEHCHKRTFQRMSFYGGMRSALTNLRFLF
jgi:hypothetical protein